MKDNYNENLNEEFDNENNHNNRNNNNNEEEIYFRHGKPIPIKELIQEIIQDIEHEMEIAARKEKKEATKNLLSHLENDFFKSTANHISKLNDDKS